MVQCCSKAGPADHAQLQVLQHVEHVRDGPARCPRGREHRHLAKLAELAGGRSRERDEKDRRSRDYPLREDRGKPSGLRDEEPLERKRPEPRPEVRVPEPDNPDDQDIRELQATSHLRSLLLRLDRFG